MYRVAGHLVDLGFPCVSSRDIALSAPFCLGRWESGRMGRSPWQQCWKQTTKSLSTKNSLRGDRSPCYGRSASDSETNVMLISTRYGPNRPAADMEGNGEFDFWAIFKDFCRLSRVNLESF